MSNRLEDMSYLKDSLNHMGEEELRRTLAYLIKVYVLDKESSGLASTSRMPAEKNTSFFDLMTALKTEYRTPELNRFQMEAGKVYIEINNRRVEISEGDSPTPMQPVIGGMGAMQTPPSPVMSPPSAPQTPPPTPQTREPEPVSSSDTGESPQRFRSLEF